MIRVGLVPNVFTYTSLVDAYCKVGNLSDVFRMGNEMMEVGVEWNVVTYTELIDGLCDVERTKEAEEMFGKMVTADVATTLSEQMAQEGLVSDRTAYTSLIDGNLKQGNVVEALALRDKMGEIGMKLDLLAYTSLVWGLSQCNQLQKARTFLEEMIGEGIILDEVLCLSVLKKHYELGCVEEAVELQSCLMKHQLLTSDNNDTLPIMSNSVAFNRPVQKMRKQEIRVLKSSEDKAYRWICCSSARVETLNSQSVKSYGEDWSEHLKTVMRLSIFQIAKGMVKESTDQTPPTRLIFIREESSLNLSFIELLFISKSNVLCI
ncbi:hypothetical protein Bca52824_030704 [Brassica carinata]|uniref:Pentatricopeptide repeat-containing protein n=1 Tax=Brassica carinata TaxID=52824 RepID=A0A8X7S993_BRACI|nr:hypothetical protein Bca52824_030704 [Brassica carinata]